MSNNTDKRTTAFLGILKAFKVPMEEAAALTYALEEEDLILEAAERLVQKQNNLSAKEAMTICAEVLRGK